MLNANVETTNKINKTSTNFIQNLSDIGNREIISKQFLLSQNNLYTKTQQDYHKKQKFIGQTLS